MGQMLILSTYLLEYFLNMPFWKITLEQYPSLTRKLIGDELKKVVTVLRTPNFVKNSGVLIIRQFSDFRRTFLRFRNCEYRTKIIKIISTGADIFNESKLITDKIAVRKHNNN